MISPAPTGSRCARFLGRVKVGRRFSTSGQYSVELLWWSLDSSIKQACEARYGVALSSWRNCPQETVVAVRSTLAANEAFGVPPCYWPFCRSLPR